MKNMRIWALIICVLVVFASLVACNSNKNDDVTHTEAPTTEAPTQAPVVTEAPTTEAPTEEPTTEAPTTEEPTTEEPTTEEPTTEEPTTEEPTECTHTGGTATCTAKAICENCGEAYGELNAENHSGEKVWTKTDATHKEAWACCGAVTVEEVAHAGGTATCTAKAVCSVCATAYGEVNTENHSGTKEWTKTETTHKEAWACCGVVVTAEAAHEGGAATCTAKAVCSVCEKAYGEVNADAHTVEATWTEKTETTHTKAYTCCGVKVVDAAPHAFNADGACTECGLNCEHKGGTATCTAKAVCSVCNNAYGEVNANAHTAAQAWTKTETTHTYAYTCCGAATIDEAHEWNNGVCYECVYVCEHEGGTATCSSRPICTICAKYYGTTNPDNHTGAAIWYGEGNTETTHNKIYICCGADFVATEAHEWVDGVCAECRYVCGHTGGDAKCNELATCEWCGEKHGELDPADHTLEATWTTTNTTTHEKKHTCCDTVVVAAEGHEWENGVCTECGYTCQHNTVADKWEDGVCTNCGVVCGHSGGTATCSVQATCEICGEKYGNLDPDNHNEVAAATCLKGKLCGWCEQYYGEVDPNAHEEAPDWTSTATTHTVAFTCCGAATTEPAPHTWNLGTCSECGYVCLHPEVEATWTTKTETAHAKTYTCCGAIVVAEEAHEWVNGVCSECEYGCEHTGGTATCTDKKTCTWCGEKYGEIDANAHTVEATWTEKTETTHTKTYTCCGAVVVNAQAHTGGTAYCNIQAVCSECGTSYGAYNETNHSTTETYLQYVNETTHYVRRSCCRDVAAGEGHNTKNGTCGCGYKDPTMLSATTLANSANAAGISATTSTENGFAYAHLTPAVAYPTIDLYNSETTYGRYMLIRYKANGSGYGSTYDCYFTINGVKNTGGGKGNANWFNLRFDNTWHYIVVDLGTSSITSLTWTLFDTKNAPTAAKGNWLEIEYIKFFDSYAAAKSFEVSRHPDGNIYPFYDENGSKNTATSNVPIGQIYYATAANSFATGAAVPVANDGKSHLTMDWGFCTANGGYKLIVTVAPGSAVAQGDIGIQINNNDIEWGVSIVPQAGVYWCFANIADRVSLNTVNTLRVVVRNANAIADEPIITLASYTITIAG